MDRGIGVLELPRSWCLPRLAEVIASRQQRESTAETLPALSASNSPHPLPDLRCRPSPPALPLRNIELGASLMQIESMANTSRLPVYTSPVPPPSDERPFEPHVRRFEDYHGQWISDSEDEALTSEQLDACDTPSNRENEQVKRHAALFAVVNPAHGHKLQPRHAHRGNQMQEI